MSTENPIETKSPENNQSLDCSSPDPSRKWYQARLFSFGITPTGYVAVGVAPMGVVAIGIVPMGVISVGMVGMGAIAAGFVTMGMVAFGEVNMSYFGGHKGGKGHGAVPTQEMPMTDKPMEKPMEHSNH
ncbi:hypothetical protein [Synechocystis sp. CACIAM 05]|uniref:hypothetical protein n=1 Tax=Synechocystis sp. CACIAM 05 TaxID=1933929 RepID=UPI00138E6C43|nr:hypothetical protein [Synechocystis sp. CACIAM 05]QHV01564.1 hypothetical protein BWK47_16460 [Synechocystis sp. CACIAM 05]